MKIRITWQYHEGHPNTAALHCDLELFRYTPGQQHSLLAMFGQKPDQPTADQQRLVDDLFSVHGISNVAVSSYQIAIERGAVFAWDEIRPRVEQVLAEWAGAEGTVEVEAKA